MKLKIFFQLLLVFTFLSCVKIETCTIETSEGFIVIELYPEKAPISVANFLKYVDEGHYTNSSFFRVTTHENEGKREIKIDVIQGGNVMDGNEFPPIEIETTDKTGIKHIKGAISMARGDINTATSSFFICVNEQPELDFGGKRNPDGYGFAAFGKVIKGMEVVRKIHSGDNIDQLLTNPIVIKSITRTN